VRSKLHTLQFSGDRGADLKYLAWLLKAAIFFTLFAFALNNQQDATVHFFFGTQWTAPLVLVVLTVFAAGLALGALFMVPRWWRHRRGITAPPQTQMDQQSTLVGQGTPPPHGL
jgi:putative membrane protein